SASVIRVHPNGTPPVSLEVAHDCELTENRLSRDVDQWLDQIAARQRLGWVVGVRRAGSELPEPMRRKVDHECVDGHLLSAGKAAALVRLSNGLTAKRFHPIRCWLSRHNARAQLRAHPIMRRV